MYVDLSACVRRIFDELDIDDLLLALSRPGEAAVELTGRAERPVEIPAPGR